MNIYFNENVEQAIIRYKNSTCQKQKQQIYKQYIYSAFQYIINSMIKRYKLIERIENVQIIKISCFSQMIQKIKSFDCKRGRAFTFFTIIAKHFILNELNHGIKFNQRNISINKLYQGRQSTIIQDLSVKQYQQSKHMQRAMNIYKNICKQLIEYINQNLFNIITTKKQQVIVYSLIKLIEDVQKFQNYGKKFIFLYLRQLSGASTKEIVNVLKRILPQYKKIKDKAIQQEYIYSKIFYQEI